MLSKDSYNYATGFKGADFVHGQKGDLWITDPSIPLRLPAQPHKIKAINSLIGYQKNHYMRRYEREYCVGRTFTRAIDWLETNYNQESFFLWVDMWDPHEPFDCPWYDINRYADSSYNGDRIVYPTYGRSTYMSSDEQEYVRSLYAGNITLVDRWVGQFMDTVEKLDLLRNTLIIWTTDHGHLFGDHNLQGKPGAELGTLYEETTRIPLLVHHPHRLGEGKRIQGIVQPPDILPSILDFLGLDIPSQVQGKSFWPLVNGDQKKIHEYAFSGRFPMLQGKGRYQSGEGASFDGWVGSKSVVEPCTITNNRWAFLCAPEGRTSELYDLESDPSQNVNIIEKRPDVAKKMKNIWIAFLESHGAQEERLQPFREGETVGSFHEGAKLYAFRDDLGQWIAYQSEEKARMNAFREDAPGPQRRIREIYFGDVVTDNLKNLVFLNDQFYWAEDLCKY
jgi:arylsulfatase A-like enzyme